jgi:hypothetical protein
LVVRATLVTVAVEIDPVSGDVLDLRQPVVLDKAVGCGMIFLVSRFGLLT